CLVGRAFVFSRYLCSYIHHLYVCLGDVSFAFYQQKRFFNAADGLEFTFILSWFVSLSVAHIGFCKGNNFRVEPLFVRKPSGWGTDDGKVANASPGIAIPIQISSKHCQAIMAHCYEVA